jgi:translation initiation factor 6 (eIF-6)
MRNIIFLLLLIFFGTITQTKAQFSASFYNNSDISKIGVAYPINEKLWTEAKLYSGTNIDNTTLDLVLNYNFWRKEIHQMYIGGGMSVGNVNAIVIPLGLQVAPIESLKNLSFHIEFQPLYEIDLDDIFLQGFWGIRYTFN